MIRRLDALVWSAVKAGSLVSIGLLTLATLERIL